MRFLGKIEQPIQKVDTIARILNGALSVFQEDTLQLNAPRVCRFVRPWD